MVVLQIAQSNLRAPPFRFQVCVLEKAVDDAHARARDIQEAAKHTEGTLLTVIQATIGYAGARGSFLSIRGLFRKFHA